jgi:hypothetical protein
MIWRRKIEIVCHQTALDPELMSQTRWKEGWSGNKLAQTIMTDADPTDFSAITLNSSNEPGKTHRRLLVEALDLHQL